MTEQDRAYFSALVIGIRTDINRLRRDLAKIESMQNRLREAKHENSRLVGLLDKHGINADKEKKRGRPQKDAVKIIHDWSADRY